jgi:hypothetical protein
MIVPSASCTFWLKATPLIVRPLRFTFTRWFGSNTPKLQGRFFSVRPYDVTFFRPASKISLILRAMMPLPMLRFMEPP